MGNSKCPTERQPPLPIKLNPHYTDELTPFDWLPETILDLDDIEFVMRRRHNRSLFLIDIAVPGDITAEVQQIENVYLYNIDRLEQLVRENVRMRESEHRYNLAVRLETASMP